MPAGRPPFGWRAAPGGLIADAAEQSIVQLIRELRGQGLSLRQIASKLNDSGRLPRRGRWHPITVARALQRRR